ncbi:MAG: hypothetical protein IJP61_08495 [Treponema sp.]|nr:hypothetical protein [Treponema sp.]
MNFIRKNIVFILPVLFVLLAIFFLIPKNHGTRRVFYFPSVGSDKVCREVRYLPSDAVQGAVRSYVDELLLGSCKRGRFSLFTLGTVCEFCFVQDKTVFVGLSADAALQLADSADIENGIKLFKSSILKNFKYIDYVELFIDGNYVENR